MTLVAPELFLLHNHEVNVFVFLVKCLHNYWMDCKEIWYRHSCSLTFHLTPSSGQHFKLSNTLAYNQIPAKQRKFDCYRKSQEITKVCLLHPL